MHATRAPIYSQRAIRVIAALPVIATTFAMHAMLGRRSRQIKMLRPDAYGAVEADDSNWQRAASNERPLRGDLPKAENVASGSDPARQNSEGTAGQRS